MYCEKCGEKLEDDSLFCESCGTKIENMETPTQAQDAILDSTNVIQPQSSVPPAYITAKQPITKGLKTLLVEILVLLLVCVAFFQIGTKHFSPEAVAKNYFMAEINGNWNQVYSMMDLPASPMLTAEMFLQSSSNNNLEDVTNYEVTESNNVSQSVDSMIRIFECKYMPKGGSSMETEYLQLVKQQNKEWLFFSEWKVSPSNHLIENYKIAIPADAAALLNGIPMEEIAGKATDIRGGVKNYLLPKAFPGKYHLTIQAPYRQEYTEELMLDEFSYQTIISYMDMDANILESVSKLCCDTLQQLFSTAANAASYDTLLKNLKSNITENFDCLRLYEDIKSNFTEQQDVSHQSVWQSIFMKQIDYQYSGTSYEDEENLYMRVNAALAYDYTGYEQNVDWWTREVTKNPFNKTENISNFSFLLKLDDSQWKLAEIN